MRNADGTKVQQVQSEVKVLKQKLRRTKFHWGGSKGGARRKKTGQPEWFRRMKWEATQKAILGKLPVSELVVHGICSAKQAMALRESGFKTVWSVVGADYADLLRVPGFGSKTLAKLWQDAKIKGNLTMKWKP